MNTPKARASRLCTSLALIACAAFAQAQTQAPAPAQGPATAYPTGPITVIVPTSPSTSSDIVARAISQRLTPLWKQSVVVDNRTGASGSIGIAAVARAPADGQTVLIVTNTISMVGSLHKDLPWSSQDFEPVALLGSTVTALVVNPSLPVKNVDDLIKLAKSEPGKLNYATPGIGTPHHLYTELFKEITATDIFHVPYSSTASAVTDIAGGRAQLGFFPLNAVMPLIKGNKIRVLATAGDKRSSATPDVPTFAEAHIDGVHAGSWIGVFVPKGTPKPVIDKLSNAIIALLKTPDFQQDLLRQEVVPNAHPGGPKELGALLASDTARWKSVIDTAKIVAE
jgi:tripartite-type tricarboxylate transporter receptor subunit TctC